MTDTIGAIASALQADAEAVRIISLNVANALTPAYRREIPVARASFAEVASEQHVPELAIAVDTRAGTLERTGGTLDLAIEGKGFFVVGTSNGDVLTRRGDFRLDPDGRVVTQSGDPLLGANGAIRVGDQIVSIASDGTVRAGDAIVDRLRIVEVASEAALAPVGNGTYTLTSGEQTADSASQIRQGFLETSNVQTIQETVQLMQAMRRFEMAQRFVRSYDGMMDEAISTLGRI
jgi:flagellar basal-body rod protein FlgF